jgi:hypothetical protein
MAQFNGLKRQICGGKTVPTPIPPTFVQRPWNSWTYERAAKSTVADQPNLTTINDILTQLKAKFGLSSDVSNIVVKVQSASVWCTVGGTLVLPDLDCSFFELSDTLATQAVRSQQRDKGTLNMPARAGYTFPMVDQKEVITEAEAGLIVVNAVPSSVGSDVTTRVHILWQFAISV